VHRLPYANIKLRFPSDFPFKNVCKFTKTAETIGNIENRFWLELTIAPSIATNYVLRNSELETGYQSREFSNN